MAHTQQLFRNVVDLSLMWEYHGEYPISIDNSRMGGAYALVNLGITVRPPGVPNLDVIGTVSNLLDRNYNFYFGVASAVAYAVPGDPREARLTLRYRF
jgi:outer membrane receptor protein involved in Fe transport